ncbi:CAP domain-containing protein [Poseidonocella sedimentorum]|uniref:Cysteine-rich secretory protein family protein n=1 Tax=Poseidonocella sedimentorum TaxID=871652 RepID=A0A1I6D4W8_9RHOB|nr:CAP domain-containing protein [Poseidonocella sedimentorum]SFR00347.1 Cysteine-rich secretory protein family protein [Poseidonocella sedimentorum]
MLNRRAFLVGSSLLALGACTAAPTTTLGPDGKPLPRVYRIAQSERDAVQFRMLDSVNALRAAVGAPPLAFNAALNAAAATHARDMARQNRPWHFGSDGSSPVDRVRRVGYPGLLVGETISETFETELETLAAWMEQPDTRRIILDRRATDLGFDWHQESSGKLWWVLEVGAAGLDAAETIF